MQPGPQNPPQYPQQPYPGAPYPPPPGMPPQYYQPPPKKGFPVWAIVLIVCLCTLPVCGIFGLAAIPLITTNTRDARRGEGEQMLGSMKNRVKVAFAKLNMVPSRLTGDLGQDGCGVSSMELNGKYFRVRDAIDGDEKLARIKCDPNPSGNASDGTGELAFSLSNPYGDTITWQ